MRLLKAILSFIFLLVPLTASILSAGLQLDTAASLPEATLKSAESLAIQTGLQNRNLGDILISDVVDAGAAQVAHGIGSAHATGTLGELGHKAAHGTLAFTGAKLTGRDPVGAAVGAVVGEIAAETLHEDGKDPAKTANQARLVANTVAFLAGQDVASADAAAQNAIENNWWWTLDAYHYGKIYAEKGKEGIIEEIKEHPVEAALAAGGLGWVGRVGKGAKVVSKLAKTEKLEHKTTNFGNVGKTVAKTETVVNPETRSKELAKIGRQGKEKRLVEISEDWKIGKADKGWINQEKNHAKRGGRGVNRSKVLRNPPGKVLAHKRGKEAAKGFDYSHADLQEIDLHKTQHKYDNYGKNNK